MMLFYILSCVSTSALTHFEASVTRIPPKAEEQSSSSEYGVVARFIEHELMANGLGDHENRQLQNASCGNRLLDGAVLPVRRVALGFQRLTETDLSATHWPHQDSPASESA